MSFIYSLKLFSCNWAKALKLFLYYLIVWGVCFCLLLPCFFAFKDIVVTEFQAANIQTSFSGVFRGTLGEGMHNIAQGVLGVLTEVTAANLGLFIYGIFVIFILMPFLLNLGKYTFCSMLYYFMTSKSEVGFCGTMIKTLKNSTCFAAVKVFHNIVFLAITLVSVYSLCIIDSPQFYVSWLPIVAFVLLVLLFTIEQILVLGWCPAMVVFNSNVFVAYQKGFKAVRRHFLTTLGTTVLYFALFWAFVMIFGVFTMTVLVPLMTILLCVYNMVAFFISQGMRFYVNENRILTPKKLEEVDNINKTAFIL